MRKPVILYAETNAQISCAVFTYLIRVFLFSVRTMLLHSNFDNSSFKHSSINVLSGLCRAWLKTPMSPCLMYRLFLYRLLSRPWVAHIMLGLSFRFAFCPLYA